MLPFSSGSGGGCDRNSNPDGNRGVWPDPERPVWFTFVRDVFTRFVSACTEIQERFPSAGNGGPCSEKVAQTVRFGPSLIRGAHGSKQRATEFIDAMLNPRSCWPSWNVANHVNPQTTFIAESVTTNWQRLQRTPQRNRTSTTGTVSSMRHKNVQDRDHDRCPIVGPGVRQLRIIFDRFSRISQLHPYPPPHGTRVGCAKGFGDAPVFK